MLKLLLETERTIHLNPDAAATHLSQAITLLTADSHSEPQHRVTGGLAQWQVARIDDFIEQNLGQCIRTKELASLLSLSTSYFSHLFKQTMGMPPLMYVAARRVEAAGQYMLCSESSLSEIAQSHGFCDQSHFCRVFKRETGLSPQTWRKLYSGTTPRRRQASTPLAPIQSSGSRVGHDEGQALQGRQRRSPYRSSR